MNTVPIIDPVQGDFPETIDGFLEHGVTKCVAFNRRGTLLAAGCSNGSLVIWDFNARCIYKEIFVCLATIISVCWSKYGHRILVSAADKSLTLWEVATGEKIARLPLQHSPMQARLHPGSSSPSICLVCPLSSPPLIIDLFTKTVKALPLSIPDTGIAVHPPFMPTAACFSMNGDLVYVGNSKGEILIIDHERIEIRGVISITGSATIKSLVFSRNGQYLLTNSEDKSIKIYENLLPLKDALKALDKIHQKCSEQDETEKLKAVGRRCLDLSTEIQDTEPNVQWKAACFSGDGEWILAGSSRKVEHKICIWNRAGLVVRTLDGPKSAVMDIAWHPAMPIIVSVSWGGKVYIWVKECVQKWSAYAPTYKELDENEEYVEREDEFDLVPDTVLYPEHVDVDDIVDEDDLVDVVTIEKDPAFSDSDMSQGEIRYAQDEPIEQEKDEPIQVEENDEEDVVVPISDVPEEEKKDVPTSEEPEDCQLTTNQGFPVQENSGRHGAKRERRPSTKFADFLFIETKYKRR